MKKYVRLSTAVLFLASLCCFCGTRASLATESQVATDSKETIRVAVYRGEGASDTCANASKEILNGTEGFEADFISAGEIQDGKLKEYDVVIFPGGTGSGESKALGDKGWEELRAFVKNGGGYVGVCAGAYLALYKPNRSTGNLISAELQEGEWERGEALLEIEFTEEGRQAFQAPEGRFNVAYQNGPIVHRAATDALKPYVVLAYFRTEVAENDAPKGVQIDSPAIVAAEYGAGRVLICSPHPELTPNLHYLTAQKVKYVARKADSL